MAPREHFTNGRSLWFATGFGLVLAAFAAQIAVWPHWISIGCGYGSGIVLMLSAAVFIAKSYYSPEHIPPALLSIPAVIPLTVRQSGLKWRVQHDGMDSSVVVVRNSHQFDKERTSPAREIAASLQFSDAAGPMLFVNRAYWLDAELNQVDIPIGTSRNLLIGAAIDDKWLVFENYYSAQPEDKLPDGTSLARISAPRRLPLTETLTVKVTAYCQLDGQVLAEAVFRIPRSGEIVNLIKRKDRWMSPEMKEGPEALKRFEDGMKKLFQTPKPVSPFKPSPAKPKEETSRD